MNQAKEHNKEFCHHKYIKHCIRKKGHKGKHSYKLINGEIINSF